MVEKTVERSPIYSEFSPEEIEIYFGLSRQKVVSHIDTFYYTVSLLGDSIEPDDNVHALLNRLWVKKKEKAKDYSSVIEIFGLQVQNVRFAHYEYCLSIPDMFDIFIASTLPNLNTPRIVVQLRTRMLVLDGVSQAICKSFRYVQDILNLYGIEVGVVNENRIDYAYHTNYIQNPYEYFSDKFLVNHMKASLRVYKKCGVFFEKVGKVGNKITIDYLSLGQRSSNNVFVRIYNKSREVVEQNYKAFFFDRWLEKNLISRYDYEVYMKAYQYKSYLTGLLIGRIDWYLDHGKNQEIKDELLAVKQSCYVDSDNIDQLKKIVDRYLPPVTLIVNIEFQTKRRFYKECDQFIEMYLSAEREKISRPTFDLSKRVIYANENKIFDAGFEEQKGSLLISNPYQNPLLRLQVINSLSPEIMHYLTSKVLCFVKKKGDKKDLYSNMCYFWQRIHKSRIHEYDDQILELFRAREREADMQRSGTRFKGSVAYMSLLYNDGKNKDSNFVEDLSDLLCALNDNDVHKRQDTFDPEIIRSLNICPIEYGSIKERKFRQNKHLFDLKKDES